MKILKVSAIAFALLLFIQFLSYWLVEHFSFIPLFEWSLIACCNIVCIILVILFFRKTRPLLRSRSRLLRNSFLTISVITIVLVMSTGIFFSLMNSNSTGLMQRYVRQYYFREGNIHFYVYRNGYDSQWTTIRYSMGKEWQNHSIHGLYFSGSPDVVIEAFPDHFIIRGDNKTYSFQPASRTVILVSRPLRVEHATPDSLRLPH